MHTLDLDAPCNTIYFMSFLECELDLENHMHNNYRPRTTREPIPLPDLNPKVCNVQRSNNVGRFSELATPDVIGDEVHLRKQYLGLSASYDQHMGSSIQMGLPTLAHV